MEPTGNQKPSIDKNLLQNSSQYNFMQFMQLLEQSWLEQPLSANTNSPNLNLTSTKDISFPGSDIKSAKLKHEQVSLELTFMGLCGTDSPLPQYFAEYIQANNAGSDCMYDFLNIFNNRIYLLLYLVWKKYHIFLNPEKSNYLKYLTAISGNSLTANDQREFAFAGLLGSQHHNSSSLTASLSDYLQAPVSIQEFIPTWVDLGDALTIGHDHIIIGDNAMLGNQAAAAQKIIIQIGPLTLTQAQQILPDQDSYQRLTNLIKRYIDMHISCDIILLLRPASTCITLGKKEAKLGWTSWLGKRGELQIRFKL